MSEMNPYQAPSSDPVAFSVEQATFRFDGKDVWVRDGASLPERCIYTNVTLAENPELRTISKKITWVNPLFALLLLLNVIIYLVVALCVQKKGRIQFLADHRVLRKKRLKALGGFFLFLLAVAAFIGGLVLSSESEQGGFALGALILGLGGIIATLIFMIRAGNSVRTSKFSEGWFRLSGCGKPFLDSLSTNEKGR